MTIDDSSVELFSEFGRARLRIDHSANGPRLMIRSVRTGLEVWLDPLEVESLALMDQATRDQILFSDSYQNDMD